MDKEHIEDTLRSQIDSIKKYQVARIGLFGSFASDNPTDKSDIDILVEFEQDGVTFDNYMGLKIFLEDLLEKDIDLVIKDDVREELRDSIFSSVKYV